MQFAIIKFSSYRPLSSGAAGSSGSRGWIFLASAGGSALRDYPAYLSRVERGEVAPPGEEALVRLAKDLGEDPDAVLAMAGKISADLRAVILARPQLFAELIRQMKKVPDSSVLRIVRDVRDGNW